MCWWSTGVDGTHVPTIAHTRGAHMPAAFTIVGAAIRPCSVRTPVTAPSGERSMPVTRQCWMISTPSSRAAFASAYVVRCGSSQPSCGTQMPPNRLSGEAAGIFASAASGSSSSTFSPMPRARETPRRISASCSADDAMRSEPVASNTPSSL